MSSSLAIVLAACLAPLADAQSPFAFREISPTALELSDGGKPVFVYNFGPVLAPGFPESRTGRQKSTRRLTVCCQI